VGHNPATHPLVHDRAKGVTVLSISSLSTAYVLSDVGAKISGANIDPTGDTVQMAFVPGSRNPEAGDWKTSSWETNTLTTPDTYSARCLVGPAGAVELVPGIYSVWVKVTDSPEVVVRNVGSLQVT
jgi:hypothetical protein